MTEMIPNLWFLFKIGVAFFVVRKTWRYLIDKVMNMILYIPNTPSKEERFPECNPLGLQSPGEHGHDFDNITITTEDKIKLKGWFIKQENPRDVATLIFFHGNAGNIGNRLPNIHYLYEECQVNIIIVGYRGYGHSEGNPSESGLK